MKDKINFNDCVVEVEIIDAVLGRWAVVDYAETDSSKLTYLRNRELIQPKLVAGSNVEINTETNEISVDINEGGLRQLVSEDVENVLRVDESGKLSASLKGALRDRGSVPTRADLPLEASNFDAYMISSEQLVLFAYNDAFLGLFWLPLSFSAEMSEYPKKTEVTEEIYEAGVALREGVTNEIQEAGEVLKEEIGKAVRYIGSVTSFGDLPIDAVHGDMYNVETAYGDYPAHNNWVWIKKEGQVGFWDSMGPVVDLSNKVDKIVGKGLSDNNYTDEEAEKLFGVEAGAQKNIAPPEYGLIETATEDGYSKSYSLTKDGIAVGNKINIPKDLVVESGELITVTVIDEPYLGAIIGDKYIALVLNNAEETHINIPVKDLVDVYSADELTLTLINGTFSLSAEYKDKIDNIEEVINNLPDELDNKVDKVDGKQLSSNDYTDADKANLTDVMLMQANVIEGIKKLADATVLVDEIGRPFEDENSRYFTPEYVDKWARAEILKLKEGN